MSHHEHPAGPPGAIPLAAAQAGIEAAVRAAGERGAGVVVAVAAASGDPIALARMDGVPAPGCRVSPAQVPHGCAHLAFHRLVRGGL